MVLFLIMGGRGTDNFKTYKSGSPDVSCVDLVEPKVEMCCIILGAKCIINLKPLWSWKKRFFIKLRICNMIGIYATKDSQQLKYMPPLCGRWLPPCGYSTTSTASRTSRVEDVEGPISSRSLPSFRTGHYLFSPLQQVIWWI